MDGLIEFAPDIAMVVGGDRETMKAAIHGQQALLRLRTRDRPSIDRLRDLMILRSSSKTCPFAALALGCLFDAAQARNPRFGKLACDLYGRCVKLAALRLKQAQNHAVRQVASEALRLLAIQALQAEDLGSAAGYLKLANRFVPHERPYDPEAGLASVAADPYPATTSERS